MISTDNVKEYFERLAISHKDIQQFYFGDYDEILEAERHDILYPCLWFESAEISWNPSNEDMLVEEYENSFIVLAQTKPGNKEQLKYNISFTEKIARELVLKMKCDAENEDLQFKIESVSMYRILSQNSNSDTGWRVSFKLQPIQQSYDISDKFDDVFPHGTFPSFSWQISDDEGTKTIALESKVHPDISDFDFEWKFYDGVEYQTDTENENPVFESEENSFYFQLKISINGNSRVASGHSLERRPLLTGTSFTNSYNPLV